MNGPERNTWGRYHRFSRQGGLTLQPGLASDADPVRCLSALFVSLYQAAAAQVGREGEHKMTEENEKRMILAGTYIIVGMVIFGLLAVLLRA